MMVLMMGGKIAPRPSLSTSRSWIHRSDAAIAFFRSGRHPVVSTAFSARSTARKKRAQSLGRMPRSFLSGCDTPVRSSEIPALGGTGQEGLVAHMMASGTTIVLDHAEILYRLNGNQSGSRMSSGGTAGHSSQLHWPKIER